ncbi:MAG: glycosyltransferase family 39 protein [Bacteroidia bacterium]|nr:glycosyltransferase family 39 protein [Bacteroidia bacterium]
MSIKDFTRNLPWSWLSVLGATLWFLVAKWPDFSLPLFWDELGVYGPGVLHMVDHGIGLLPSSLPPELSRGHPLLFYALFATFAKLFGWSLVSIHVLSFLTSLALIWSTWLIGMKMFGEWGAVLAAISLMAMPAIFAQSQLLLPEMLLSLWLLWALYGWYSQNWILYVLMASAALLTKESALVLPLAAALYSLLFQEKGKSTLLALSPLLIFGLFLVVQRIQNGWFFFPYHTQFISFSWDEWGTRSSLLFDFLLIYQGRWIMSALLLLGAGFVVWNRKSLQIKQMHPWIRLSGIFLIGIICFTLLNVYMDRYLICLLPLLTLGLAALLPEIQTSFRLGGLVFLAVPLTFLAYQGKGGFRYDVDISYRDILEVQQAAVNQLMIEAQPDQKIYTNFPLYNSFLDPRFGFIAREATFEVTPLWREPVSLVASISPGVEWMGTPLDSMNMLWQITRGYSSCEVYLAGE